MTLIRKYKVTAHHTDCEDLVLTKEGSFAPMFGKGADAGIRFDSIDAAERAGREAAKAYKTRFYSQGSTRGATWKNGMYVTTSMYIVPVHGAD